MFQYYIVKNRLIKLMNDYQGFYLDMNKLNLDSKIDISSEFYPATPFIMLMNKKLFYLSSTLNARDPSYIRGKLEINLYVNAVFKTEEIAPIINTIATHLYSKKGTKISILTSVGINVKRDYTVSIYNNLISPQAVIIDIKSEDVVDVYVKAVTPEILGMIGSGDYSFEMFGDLGSYEAIEQQISGEYLYDKSISLNSFPAKEMISKSNLDFTMDVIFQIETLDYITSMFEMLVEFSDKLELVIPQSREGFIEGKYNLEMFNDLSDLEAIENIIEAKYNLDIESELFAALVDYVKSIQEYKSGLDMLLDSLGITSFNVEVSQEFGSSITFKMEDYGDMSFNVTIDSGLILDVDVGFTDNLTEVDIGKMNLLIDISNDILNIFEAVEMNVSEGEIDLNIDVLMRHLRVYNLGDHDNKSLESIDNYTLEELSEQFFS